MNGLGCENSGIVVLGVAPIVSFIRKPRGGLSILFVSGAENLVGKERFGRSGGIGEIRTPRGRLFLISDAFTINEKGNVA